MAGTDDDNSIKARISPTEALHLLMTGGLSAHKAAARLTAGAYENDCRLWCNGNLLPAEYIATSLKVVARPEADGRWRADVMSTRDIGWQQPRDSYVFEFDDEVKALLRSSPAPAPLPPPPSPPERSKPLQESPSEKAEKWLISMQAKFFQLPEKRRSRWVRNEAYPQMREVLRADAPWDSWQSLRRAMYPNRGKKI
jgi:hypothetical protein